uniref:SCAPER_N domain-containing protein n=1 Tax=Heterorhabditis bacteriophora TaxID=37862 RepID=A0A1I7XPG8_HETBA
MAEIMCGEVSSYTQPFVGSSRKDKNRRVRKGGKGKRWKGEENKVKYDFRRVYDHLDCMRRCDHSDDHEKFAKMVRAKCRFVLQDIEESLNCISRYHSFVEIRCSTFLKEAEHRREIAGPNLIPDRETCSRIIFLDIFILIRYVWRIPSVDIELTTLIDKWEGELLNTSPITPSLSSSTERKEFTALINEVLETSTEETEITESTEENTQSTLLSPDERRKRPIVTSTWAFPSISVSSSTSSSIQKTSSIASNKVQYETEAVSDENDDTSDYSKVDSDDGDGDGDGSNISIVYIRNHNQISEDSQIDEKTVTTQDVSRELKSEGILHVFNASVSSQNDERNQSDARGTSTSALTTTTSFASQMVPLLNGSVIIKQIRKWDEEESVEYAGTFLEENESLYDTTTVEGGEIEYSEGNVKQILASFENSLKHSPINRTSHFDFDWSSKETLVLLYCLLFSITLFIDVSVMLKIAASRFTLSTSSISFLVRRDE